MNLPIAIRPAHDLLRQAIQRGRSVIMTGTCSLMNFNDRVFNSDPNSPIGWRDQARWWLEGKLTAVFSWAWDGSAEEIAAVHDGEVPFQYMSLRQRAVLTGPRSGYGVHCIRCGWQGCWAQCVADDDCPECGKPVYLDPFN